MDVSVNVLLQRLGDFVRLAIRVGSPDLENLVRLITNHWPFRPMGYIAAAFQGPGPPLGHRHMHIRSHEISFRHRLLRSLRDTGLHIYETRYKLFVVPLRQSVGCLNFSTG